MLKTINTADMKIVGEFKCIVPEGITPNRYCDATGEEREGPVFMDKSGNTYFAIPLYMSPGGWWDDGGLDTVFAVVIPETEVFDIRLDDDNNQTDEEESES